MTDAEKELSQIDIDTKIVIAILKSHNIKMRVDGCGCCDSPHLTFTYEGKTMDHEHWWLDTEEEEEKK